MTQGVQDDAARREWLEQRRTGVGGSDVGPIMGFPMFGRTAVTVWEEKTGKRPLDTRITPPIKRGRLLEPILKLLYKEETGRDVMEVPPSMVRNALPTLLCTRTAASNTGASWSRPAWMAASPR